METHLLQRSAGIYFPSPLSLESKKQKKSTVPLSTPICNNGNANAVIPQTPLPQSITTKDAVLALKAAAEARYFHRDYAGALALAGQALESPGASLEAGLVHRLERKELEALQEACRRRFASLNTV